MTFIRRDAAFLHCRILGHPIYGEQDRLEVIYRLEQPENRALADELEPRLRRVRELIESDGISAAEAAHRSLALAPSHGAAHMTFVEPAIPVDDPRSSFMQTGAPVAPQAGEADLREVHVFLKGEYRAYQSKVLLRLTELGFQVRPAFADSAIVLSGRAPQGVLARMSGIDGVSLIEAPPQAASPRLHRPARAAGRYRGGISVTAT
jgi:hypothetical protein